MRRPPGTKQIVLPGGRRVAAPTSLLKDTVKYMSKYILSIDQSTQGTKALLFDVRGALLRHGADPAAADDAARLLQEAFDEAYRPGGDALGAVRARRHCHRGRP